MDFELPCGTSPRLCSQGSPGKFLENSQKKFDDCLHFSISTFLVELHLAVVLKVLLVVGFEFLFNKTFIKLVDKYQRKMH